MNDRSFLDETHRQRLTVAGCAAIGVIATFLPWAHVPMVGSIYGISFGWMGKATLILFFVTILFSMLGDRKEYLTGREWLGAVIPAALVMIIGVWKMIEFEMHMSESTADEDNPFIEMLSMSVGLSFGYYLTVLAGIGVVVSAWVLGSKDSPWLKKES